MTSYSLLDWALAAVSLANMVLLLWLGLTVLLNAERRGWGHWLAGGGLLLGAAFFVSHSAILAYGLNASNAGLRFWWRIGLSPAILLPFAWYGLTLWYSGFWKAANSPLRQRQRPWFFLVILLLLLGGFGYYLVSSPSLPSPALSQLRQFGVSTTARGVPLLAQGYVLYLILCIALSLDALRHPGPTLHAMGDFARQRARPWLMATSMMLLLVGLLVGWATFWILPDTRLNTGVYVLSDEVRSRLVRFDLAIASLIAIAIVLLGQAVVSYEVFTGKTLPRQGLVRQWRYTVLLAIGHSALVSGTLILPLRPVYGLVLSTILMTLFLALLSWRSYVERERYISHLRPFVASQQVVAHLLDHPSTAHDVDILTPFHALCQEVLGARSALLAATGPFAPLVGTPLVYPTAHLEPETLFMQYGLTELTARFTSPRVRYLLVDPARHAGAIWAVSLWSERGMMGVLLLGPKRDGGLYTQEEMEIAAASGERLLDTQTSAEVARRLVMLQRQRLTESQILDGRTRHVLHDDVLPSLHAAILSLSTGYGGTDRQAAEAVMLLTEAHRSLSDLLRQMPRAKVATISDRGLVAALREVVDGELEDDFGAVEWHIDPEAEARTRELPPVAAEVLFYAAREAMRNAARHAQVTGNDSLRLCIRLLWRDGLELQVEDNGAGFGGGEPGGGGSGQGLALHGTMMAVIGGALSVASRAGVYTRVTLRLSQETWSAISTYLEIEPEREGTPS